MQRWRPSRQIWRPRRAATRSGGRSPADRSPLYWPTPGTASGACSEQDFAAARHVIDTNITGTLRLIQLVGRDMVARRSGRILIIGSIAGFIPGSFSAVYNGTKAFIVSFSYALADEIADSGITVTYLMPGATDTRFFVRADMLDTKVGRGGKDDSADVAKIGFDAMMSGERDMVSGWKNKVQTAVASITPASLLTAQHRKKAEPEFRRDE
jgi:short-subunit dehydrogenase